MDTQPDSSKPGLAATRFTRRQAWSLVVVASAVGLDISSLAVVNAALPDIGRELALSDAVLQWIMTGYAVTFAGFLLLGGRLADVFARRTVFCAGVGIFVLGSLVAVFAPAIEILVAARALQGIGGAVSVPAAMALLFQLFPEGPLRNKALGIYTSVGGASFSLGLVFGGLLTGFFGWRSVFVLTAVIGLLVLAGARAMLPLGTSSRKSLDLPGALLVTAGLVLVVYGVNRAGQVGWTDGLTMAVLAISLVLLASFVVREARTPQPLLPLTLFRSKPVRSATIGAVVFYGVVVGLLFFAPLYMQSMLGFSPLQSGLALVPMSSAVIVSATIAGKLLSRGVSQRTLMVVGLLIIGVGLAAFLRTPLDGSYWLHLLPGVLLMGAGQGVAYAGLTAASLSGVAEDQQGAAGAFNVTAQQFGASVGTACLVAVAATADPSTAARLAGFHSAYLVAAITAVVGALLIAILPGTGASAAAGAGENEDVAVS